MPSDQNLIHKTGTTFITPKPFPDIAQAFPGCQVRPIFAPTPKLLKWPSYANLGRPGLYGSLLSVHVRTASS
ncbi:hypothetical protein Bca4012_051284 [Brassica carinata]